MIKTIFFCVDEILFCFKLTANHRGVFEFRVCNIDNKNNEDATQDCLDLNLLEITNGSKRFHVDSTSIIIHINVTLPNNLTCKHCVFQWKYITGNSWGVSNGRSCLGCGKKNEEFYGCSDISILNDIETITDLITTTTIKPIEIPRKCNLTVTFSRSFDLTALVAQYCQKICSNNCIFDKENSSQELYHACINSCDKLCICN